MTTIIDTPQRQQALDTTQSFIVQAPAGSGKTELLTQRYLALLAQAKVPEEIIAITFTRKAANEMHMRILQALQTANKPFAKAALQRNQQQQWNLLENPNRLRIQTIDSLCASITRQMPVLSHFGSQPTIADDVNKLYQQAAQAILMELEQDHVWIPALCTVLLHLDNNHTKVIELFCDMLNKRDQWLPHIIMTQKNHQSLRKHLENSLQNVIDETLLKLNTNLPESLTKELLDCLAFANKNLNLAVNNNRTQDFWHAVANLLLKKDNQWRQTVDKRNGFPPNEKIMKQRMEALLEQFTGCNDLQQALLDFRMLPPAQYSDTQWQLLNALFTLLPILAAQLQLVFQQYGAVDYIEVTQSALTALGDTQNPTDLALALDYRIQHLLIDEFQDTSVTQLRLLEQLTAGWQPDDGRTLFLVGDPMQSIYRFRKAEVGLFLQVRDLGIGNIHPIFLKLKVNFRSTAPLINWINATFAELLPTQENIGQGAITYSAAVANVGTALAAPAVHTHWLLDAKDQQEAQHVVALVQQALQANTNDKIVVLVRARSHLVEISRALKQNSIAYQAVEIEKLGEQPVIQDLLALTRALLHLGDRIAWLAILRAPWCGLSLDDLHGLVQGAFLKEHLPGAPTQTMWESLQQYQQCNLSAEARRRLDRVVPILRQSLQQRARQPLHNWIKGTWLVLGGSACLDNNNELNDAKTFFNLLLNSSDNNYNIDLMQFEDKLKNLYAETNTAANVRVEIMTIHKAKGLEFDVVILPGLARAAAKDDAKLLLLMERPTLHADTDLLLAPIKSSTAKQDEIYQYLTYEEKKKSEYETMRLLYVAATRAKKQLHLLGTLKSSTKPDAKIAMPASNSLLNYLWPIIGNNNNYITMQQNVSSDAAANQTLKRLPLNWEFPVQLPPISKPSKDNIGIKLEWLSDSARHIGTVVHQLLYKFSQENLSNWHTQMLTAYKPYIRSLLLQAGVIPKELNHCVIAVESAISQTMNDERGRWILDNRHADAHSEYSLTAVFNDEIKHFVIDRTFVDENNTRWIIDYKTTDYAEIEVDRYREQLENYAQTMYALENKPIKLGLYFPLTLKWFEWGFEA